MILDWEIEKLNFLTLREKNRLLKLGLKTIKDLVYYFPHRYEDFSKILPVSHLFDEKVATIHAWLTKITTKVNPRGTIFLIEAIFEDQSGKIKALWYNQPFLYQTLKKGSYYSLAGKIVQKNGEIFFSNPNFENILPQNPYPCIHTGRIIPVYSEVKGIKSKWIRKTMFNFLNQIKEKMEEFLPPFLLEKEKFLPLSEAVWQMHFPDSFLKNEEAKRRFEFEEIFLLQLRVFKAKMKLKQKKAFKIPIQLEKIKSFLQTLPFKLTKAQKKAIWEILKDTEKEHPMNRLLQGDVGSGKTIVALVCSLNAILSGYQVAMIAPTEILAKQHYENFKKFLKDFNFKIFILTSGQKESLKEITDGNFDIVIGTHALFQNKFNFKKLALVIFDEQHRFGVEQRQTFFKKSEILPHFLSMSATPIPRTLALTFYGDLDFSILDEMPKGRKKVQTFVFQQKDLKKMYKMIEEEIKNGGKVFFVCPRIEMKEKGKLVSDLRAVKEEVKKLKKFFPEIKIKMIYGKMKNDEKEKTISDFEKGKIDILVATNVIEEGIDISNATLIVIQNAERFGLSQLYQLRGRVGRGEKEGKCFLITHLPTEKSVKRMEALLNANNAFELAMKDLEIRGPGDFLSKKQTGSPDFKLASLTNLELIKKSEKEAKDILSKDPSLSSFPLLKKMVGHVKLIHLE